LFKVSSESIHDKDRGQSDDEYARGKKSKEMLEGVCSPEEGGYVDREECSKTERGDCEERIGE